MSHDPTKPEVFVWSSSSDLGQLRDACLQVTWQANHSARSAISPVTSVNVADEIRNTDVVVCLCRPPIDSVTRECALAAASQKPTLVFVFDPNPQGDLEALYEALRNAPEGSTVKHLKVDDPHVFATEYLMALHRIPLPRVELRSPAVWPIPAIYTQHRFFRRILHQIEQWPVVYERYGQNDRLKQSIANFFLELHLSEIVKGQVTKMFFESGSSIAILAEMFLDRMGEEWLRMSANIEIETNNILAYIYYVLAQSSRVELYPAGPPEKTYGATFGTLERVDVPIDNCSAHPIKGTARVETDRIRDYFSETYVTSGLILGATSGIDLSVTSEVIGPIGPHCGSYKNMLFKRALMESGAPMILFLDQDKFWRPFIDKRCFAVCDRDFTWDYACRNKPLAIACAFWDEDRAWPAIEMLDSLGFTHVEPERRNERPWCFIATNDRFQEIRQSRLHRSHSRTPSPLGLRV